MSEFTPGPWRVVNGLNVQDNKEKYICSTGYNHPKNSNVLGECEANAQLIASVPNLLDALQGAHDDLTDWHNFEWPECNACFLCDIVIPRSKEALAKATGKKS